VRGDVRDLETLTSAAAEADRIFHLAGQVAVTSSVRDPRADFEANALGTFNALEAARSNRRDPVFLYASTNKVYGGMETLRIEERETRYELVDLPHGVGEDRPLDFCSPYGCSKGAGDQYARDYFRIYGVRTVVFRQSCIYGPRQHGREGQGWLAWLALAALRGETVHICGDGKQVRDILHVDDLLAAFDAAVERIDEVAGEVFNVGGGPERSLSVWREYGPLLEDHLGRRVAAEHLEWRPGDQRVYVSDIRKADRKLGWCPRIEVEDGLQDLLRWIKTLAAR
jgi:CDP-paratose 2-epimerase